MPLIASSMASTFSVTRKHLIFGICLPLALLLGYLLADVQDPVSVLIIIGAIFALSIPLLMKWYHPLLVLTWNMGAFVALPGRPALWTIFAFMGILVLVLNRATGDERARFSAVRSLTMPLVAILAVVIFTAAATGGINLGIFRSGEMGGKSYFFVIAAIVGYFVLGSRYIPPERARFYIGLFFLTGLCAATPRVAALFGDFALNLVSPFFGPDFDPEYEVGLSFGEIRLRSVAVAGTAAFYWLLARHGVSGILNFRQPWWALLAFILLGVGMLGGYRSIGIIMFSTFVVLFCLEGLWRTRAAFAFIGCIAITCVGLIGFADKLPFVMQRTLSFLPLKLDPAVKFSAEVSSTWRLEMWQHAVTEVPKYLFKGKGYKISMDDIYMVSYSIRQGKAASWEGAFETGAYHNGPLTVLIIFGIYGFVAFLWLIIAGIRYLYRVRRDSPPELRQINNFLLGTFLVQSVYFLFIYGSFSDDLFKFTGILGLSVALNIPYENKTAVETAPGLQPSLQS